MPSCEPTVCAVCTLEFTGCSYRKNSSIQAVSTEYVQLNSFIYILISHMVLWLTSWPDKMTDWYIASMASTPVGSNALILEVLNRNNYKDWRPRLKTYLLAKDLWEVVEGIKEPAKLEDDEAEYKAWTKKNAEALYVIQNSCGQEMFSFIREIETAKTAWKALEQECKVLQGTHICSSSK